MPPGAEDGGSFTSPFDCLPCLHAHPRALRLALHMLTQDPDRVGAKGIPSGEPVSK